MAVAPAAGGVAPELALGLIAFTAIVSILLMRGMLAAWTHTFGAMFEYLGKALDFHPGVFGLKVHLDVGAPFRILDHAIVLTMQKALTESEHLLGWSLHAMATVAEWLVSETLSFAQATEQAFARLTHIHIPRSVRTVVETVMNPGRVIKLATAAVAGEITDLRKYVDARLKELERRGVGTLKKTMPYIPGVAIPLGLLHDLRRIDRWFHGHSKRIARLEKLLGVTGLAALITATFGAEITRFLRCKNTRGIAKAWCGADLAWLLGLLGAGVLVTERLSIVTLAEEMLGLEETIVKHVGGVFVELDGLV
jgi:hypothetical protein